jgi:hypothetical protein
MLSRPVATTDLRSDQHPFPRNQLSLSLHDGSKLSTLLALHQGKQASRPLGWVQRQHVNKREPSPLQTNTKKQKCTHQQSISLSINQAFSLRKGRVQEVKKLRCVWMCVVSKRSCEGKEGLAFVNKRKHAKLAHLRPSSPSSLPYRIFT